jgi:hypothetical protein
MFTGTLIEDLIATVERVEKRARPFEVSAAEFLIAESLIADSWFAQVNENVDHDSKLRGVA